MGFIFEIYKNIHFRYCRHLAKNTYDAEELFQNAWLKAAKNIQKSRPSKGLRLHIAYSILHIAWNTIVVYYRYERIDAHEDNFELT